MGKDMIVLSFLLSSCFSYKPPDLTWSLQMSNDRNVTFFATVPDTGDFKTLDEAYEECLTIGMNLATVSSVAEQESIFNSLSTHLDNGYPAAFWISLKRESSKESMAWQYPHGNETHRRCNLSEPIFWIHDDGEPDKHSNLNCVTMLFNNEHYPNKGIHNWHGDRCNMNYNGDQGAAHGFICATQNEMNQCKLPDYTSTTIGLIGTTTKTTEASVTSATTTRSTSTSVSIVSL